MPDAPEDGERLLVDQSPREWRHFPARGRESNGCYDNDFLNTLNDIA